MEAGWYCFANEENISGWWLTPHRNLTRTLSLNPAISGFLYSYRIMKEQTNLVGSMIFSNIFILRLSSNMKSTHCSFFREYARQVYVVMSNQALTQGWNEVGCLCWFVFMVLSGYFLWLVFVLFWAVFLSLVGFGLILHKKGFCI